MAKKRTAKEKPIEGEFIVIHGGEVDVDEEGEVKIFETLQEAKVAALEICRESEVEAEIYAIKKFGSYCPPDEDAVWVNA